MAARRKTNFKPNYRKNIFSNIPRTKNQSADVRALAEAVETLIGARGKGGNAAVQWEDLQAVGLIRGATDSTGKPTNSGGFEFNPDFVNGEDLLPPADDPTKPTGVSPQHSITRAFITWDKPTFTGYSHTKVYRSLTGNYADAVHIGNATGQTYSDVINYEGTATYWVAHVNTDGKESGIHKTNGEAIASVTPPSEMLRQISENITDSQLYSDLNSVVGATHVGNSYTVKLNSNGYVAGFGLAITDNQYNNSQHSAMHFSVDTFSVGAPGVQDLAFVIDGGRVMMDAAHITNLTVEDAHIESVGVTKLVGEIGNFIIANIAEGSITNAYIGNEIKSDNYDPVNGYGWKIDKTGFADFRNVLVRGDVLATSITAGIIEAEHIKGGAVSAVRTSSTSAGAFTGVGATLTLDAGVPAGMVGRVFVSVSFRAGASSPANIGAGIVGVAGTEISIAAGYTNGSSIQGTLENVQPGGQVTVQLTNSFSNPVDWGAMDVSLMTVLL